MDLLYPDLGKGDESYREYQEALADSETTAAICKNCGVLNVSTDVETHLREQRELWDDLFRRYGPSKDIAE